MIIRYTSPLLNVYRYIYRGIATYSASRSKESTIIRRHFEFYNKNDHVLKTKKINK